MPQTTEHTRFNLPVKKVTGNTVKENLTENAYERILPARYLIRDEDGELVEEPEELFERVAKNVAQPDKEYDDADYEESWQDFQDLMVNQKFMPNSPTLMNAGAELQQLSACFVRHPEDDLEEIFNAVNDSAQVFKSGGGMGYPFHLLRPKGDQVGSTGGISSGPMTFMEVFDTMCGTIKQGGKRRGAQMGIMRVNHPDILRFIVSKRNEESLTNFNISVGLTDDFMEAVKNNEEFTLINPRTGEPFEVSEKTAQFYNTDEEWHPTAEGSDTGKDENFWRDHADEFDYLSDWDINLQPGDDMKLPARFIWETYVDSAWVMGEPGFFNYSETNDMHTFDVDKHPSKKIEATNPCVTGDTLISTGQGVFTAEELYEQNIGTNVVVDSRLSDEKAKEASSVYKTGTKDVYKLKTEEGFELRLTADHQVMTEDGWTEAQNLQEQSQVHILNREGEFGDQGTQEEGKVLGWLVGDGQMNHSMPLGVLHFYDKDTEIAQEFETAVNNVIRSPNIDKDIQVKAQSYDSTSKHRQEQVHAKHKSIRSERLYELASEYDLDKDKLQVPDKLFRSSKQMSKGFLQGLFTADGSVQGNVEKGVSVRLSSSDEELLKETQQLLLNFGIYSKVYTERREAGKRELPDGKGGKKEYNIKAQHDLVVSKGSLLDFQEKIGFLREDKEEKLEEKLSNYTRGPYDEKFTATVESLEKDGHEDVYDLTEPDTHSFIANGLVVHNCGEQQLMNYEACNLGHINLSLLADEKENGMALKWQDFKEANQDTYDFEDEEQLRTAVQEYLEMALDNEELDRVARLGTRFLDNVVTMSDFPLEEIEETVRTHRKIGLGLMGFAQLLIQFGVRYGSEVSIEIAKDIQRRITAISVDESKELAHTRGKFEEWEKSKWANPTEHPEWFRKYTGGLDPEDYEDGYPLRNHNTTTIAPTGTTSMLGNTSGGCEPIFSMAYFKNVGKDIQGDDMLVEFDHYFIRFLEANGHDVEEVKDKAEELMNNNEWEDVTSLGDDIIPEELQDVFVSASEVTPEEHVDIQAGFQEHNHSGISKTINFDNDASKEDVATAFMRAYEKGVKGMTIYRDGSRETQVKTTRKDNKKTDKKDVKEWIKEADQEDVTEIFDAAVEEHGEERTEEVDQVTQEGVEADDSGNGEHTSMSHSGQAAKRPQTVYGSTQEITTAYGDLFVTINDAEDNGPFEVFANVGKSGGYTQSFTEAIGRLASLSLRMGADGEQIVEQLEEIRSPQIAWDNGQQVHSIPDAIAVAMRRHLGDENGAQQTLSDTDASTSENDADVEEIVKTGENPECPECGGMLQLQEGCNKCSECGFSKC